MEGLPGQVQFGEGCGCEEGFDVGVKVVHEEHRGVQDVAGVQELGVVFQEDRQKRAKEGVGLFV